MANLFNLNLDGDLLFIVIFIPVAHPEQQEWEYAGGGAWYRRLLSADINSSWEQISAGDVPDGLRWINPVRSGPEYDALLEERQASRQAR